MQQIGRLFDSGAPSSPTRVCPPRSFHLKTVNFFKRRETASIDPDVGILCDSQGPQCQVSLSGSITIDSTPDLRLLLLQRLQSSNCQSLTLDFYGVTFIGTSGLAMLVDLLKAARGLGKTFHLSRLRERPRYLLEATHLLHLFDVVSSEGPPASCAVPESQA